MKHAICLIAATIACVAIAYEANSWHDDEHVAVTSAAKALLPKDMPGFFVEGAPGLAAHCSLDPDVFKRRSTPQLRNAERPEHYLDYELIDKATLPKTRYEFIALCAKKGIDPSKVGLVPYAVIEWTQQLSLAFAEHRRWPDDPHIQAKCLVYAGLLSHYAADLCQPLHTPPSTSTGGPGRTARHRAGAYTPR